MSLDTTPYRARLLESREQLRSRLTALKRDVRAPLDSDSEEQATQLENRDVELALDDEARAELADIERALARIEEGNYGVCQDCGKDIPPARLDAYPAATSCVDCAA